jgi:hypothetical protein
LHSRSDMCKSGDPLAGDDVKKEKEKGKRKKEKV